MCAGCCNDKNALIALTFDDDGEEDDDYNDNEAAVVEFSPLVRSQSRRGFFLSPPACHVTSQDKFQIFI